MSTRSTTQSINRNMSVDRERLSNATIIGLYIVLGHSMIVKLPSKKSKNTLAHLSIASTCINGVEVSKTLLSTFPKNSADKNVRRDKEVSIFNMVSKIVAGDTFKLAKRTTAVKTLKLKIFKEVGPFTRDGLVIFGKRITESLLSRNLSGRCSQKSFVDIKGADSAIMKIFTEVVSVKTNVSCDPFEWVNSHEKSLKNETKSETREETSWEKIENINHDDRGTRIHQRGVFSPVNVRFYTTKCSEWFV
ncbi:hypothetical protein EIN_136030 [Entamoeba invadens IP1]|uniref:Uncharacterized protein n=1 Tax=Entamoeba invadens IP1 TaxID=370355 RepID=A0A0A1U338_ENTIV|nr:hypothetical protein EIN_136030 [Entamoeba invadens IP1]ELP85969.1 hypothetical protein EIN_136030 [Entamoeba invadens IP1]|eukprot:XP_004185315.1 hypothetical protein EIN_136030 [Entamoeba invadens IP1]